MQSDPGGGGFMFRRQIIFCLLLLLPVVRAFFLIAQPAPAPRLPALLAETDARREVWVWGEIASIIRQGPRSVRFAFDIQGRAQDTNATFTRTPLSPPSRVWVSWPMSPAAQKQLRLMPGELWMLPLRWRNTRAVQEAGEFDTWRWMQQQGLQGLAQVTQAKPLAQRLAQAGGPARLRPARPSMQGWRQQVRNRLFATIDHPRTAGLVAALSMGDQNAIEKEDWDIFRRTGVAHLVSISGMHVTLLAIWLAALMQSLWRVLRWRQHTATLWLAAPGMAQGVALLTATLYAFFSGWGLPAQRTVWMLLLTAGLRVLGWSWPPHMAWLALVGLVAAFDPLALSQSGFWLSYVAVALLYAVEPASGDTAWRRWLHEGLGLQWRITFALAPLSLYFFQGVSLAGLWVNLWAIPWVTLVVTPLSLLGLIFSPLWVWADWSAGWLLLGLEWAARTPLALVEVPQPALWRVLAATGFAMAAVLPGPGLWRAWCAALVLSMLAG
jgi:competence protein ComEC